MTAGDIKSAVDAAVAGKVLLTYPQLVLFVLLSGIGAYFGAYLKQKGQNLASKEDIEGLTKQVEEIRSNYAKQVEDYRQELLRRSRVSEVAEFFTEWGRGKDADKVKLNGYCANLSLWMPNDLYRDLGKCVTYSNNAPSPKQVLIKLREHLLRDEAGDLKAEEIIHFN